MRFTVPTDGKVGRLELEITKKGGTRSYSASVEKHVSFSNN